MIRTPVRIATEILLVILNITMILLYKRRMRKLDKITLKTEEKVKLRKEADKDLCLLCICQSCLTRLDQTLHSVQLLMRQQSMYWAQCFLVMVPEGDAAIMWASALEFVLLIGVNKKIRKTITGFGFWKKLWSKTQVVPFVG